MTHYLKMNLTALEILQDNPVFEELSWEPSSWAREEDCSHSETTTADLRPSYGTSLFPHCPALLRVRFVQGPCAASVSLRRAEWMNSAFVRSIFFFFFCRSSSGRTANLLEPERQWASEVDPV